MGNGRLAVLVVDRDPLIRDGLAHVLTNSDFDVMLAIDGDDAVRRIGGHGRRPELPVAALCDPPA